MESGKLPLPAKKIKKKKKKVVEEEESSDESDPDTDRERNTKKRKIKKKLDKKEESEKIKKKYDTVMVEMTEEEQLRYLEYERSRLIAGMSELKEENKKLKTKRGRRNQESSEDESSSEDSVDIKQRKKKRRKKRRVPSSESEEQSDSEEERVTRRKVKKKNNKKRADNPNELDSSDHEISNMIPESMIIDKKMNSEIKKIPPRDYSEESGEEESEIEEAHVIGETRSGKPKIEKIAENMRKAEQEDSDDELALDEAKKRRK